MNAEIRRYVIDELLSGREVSDEDALLLSGLIDSLGVMRLVAFIERQRSVTIPPQDITIDNFANLSAIFSYLDGLAKE